MVGLGYDKMEEDGRYLISICPGGYLWRDGIHDMLF